MAQLILCDLCQELIKPGDKKFLFAYYIVIEDDEETRKLQYEELIRAIYKGRNVSNEDLKIVEICEKCVGVFANFLKLRQEDLKKSRAEVQKMLTLKTKKEKKQKPEKK